MWRLTAILCVWTTTASAWQFSPTPICTLSNNTDEASLRITYDPRVPEYRLEIRLRQTGWPDTSPFSMSFQGNNSLTIATGRHELSDGSTSLSVTDRGFGNVLDGIEFNSLAIATLGDLQIAFPLEGAAPQVQQFRACPAPGLV